MSRATSKRTEYIPPGIGERVYVCCEDGGWRWGNVRDAYWQRRKLYYDVDLDEGTDVLLDAADGISTTRMDKALVDPRAAKIGRIGRAKKKRGRDDDDDHSEIRVVEPQYPLGNLSEISMNDRQKSILPSNSKRSIFPGKSRRFVNVRAHEANNAILGFEMTFGYPYHCYKSNSNNSKRSREIGIFAKAACAKDLTGKRKKLAAKKSYWLDKTIRKVSIGFSGKNVTFQCHILIHLSIFTCCFCSSL